MEDIRQHVLHFLTENWYKKYPEDSKGGVSKHVLTAQG